MILGKKIELRPNQKQFQHLAQHAGTARFTYNWGLAQRIEHYKLWVLLDKPKKWNGWDFYPQQHKKLNLLKKKSVEEGGYPWMYEVSKCAPQEALRDLDKAFKSFLSGKSAYPRFKSKNKDKDSFRLTGTIKVFGSHIQLPVLGKIRIQPNDRGYIPNGKYGMATICKEVGRWFVSLFIEEKEQENISKEIVGIDIGCSKLATLSNGKIYQKLSSENPNVEKVEKKIKKLQKELSRRQKGSKNRAKAKENLQKAHYRLRSIRSDYLQKTTTEIAKNHGIIVVEDLKLKNMVKKGGAKKRGLNRVLHSASLGELLRLLEYKTKKFGSKLLKINPQYTSQRCSKCGHISKENRKTQASFQCQKCTLKMNADQNASFNILKKGLDFLGINLTTVVVSTPNTLNACREFVRPRFLLKLRQDSMKQEHHYDGFSPVMEKSLRFLSLHNFT